MPILEIWYAYSGCGEVSNFTVKRDNVLVEEGTTQQQCPGTEGDFIAWLVNGYMNKQSDTVYVNGGLWYEPYKPLMPDCGNLGDVLGDGQIGWDDAQAITDYASGLITLSPEQLSRANVNGDGIINIIDALAVNSYLSGTITTFSGCPNPPPPPPECLPWECNPYSPGYEQDQCGNNRPNPACGSIPPPPIDNVTTTAVAVGIAALVAGYLVLKR